MIQNKKSIKKRNRKSKNTENNYQKLSVITVVKNNKNGLIATLKSISTAKIYYKKFKIEWIVIDACSSDGTQDVIQNNSKIIDKYLIEKDQGLYDAMNKGIRIASGEFLLFLNSGDQLFSNNKIESLFPLSNRKIHVFEVEMYEKNMTFPWFKNSPYLLRMPCHQGMVILKNINNEIYYYNIKYKINADLDYKLRIYKQVPFKYYNGIKLAKLEKWGVSQNYDSILSPVHIALREATLAYMHNGVISAILNFSTKLIWHTLKFVRVQIRK